MARNGSERQTPREKFRIPVLQALADAGGSVPHKDRLLPQVEAKMRFVPADLTLRPDGTKKWVRKIGYVIGELRKDGLIEPAARNGVTITEKGRDYVLRLTRSTP